MERQNVVGTAILDLLRELQVQPGTAISMYEIGVPLIPKGFDQHELVNALYSMQTEGVIELLPANGLRLLKPL